MSDDTRRFQVGDPVRLKDSDINLRGDVWQLRTGQYVVVRWEDACRSTHSQNAIEYDGARDPSKSSAGEASEG